MPSSDQNDASGRPPGPPRRPRAVDPRDDALVRREEEFRRFLVSVVTPALEELRSSFRAEGRSVHIEVTTRPGHPSEATITVTRDGDVEFYCAIYAAISPEQATVYKRRPVPGIVAGALSAREETTYLNHSEPQSNATSITRAEVVASIRTDYWMLHRPRHGAG